MRELYQADGPQPHLSCSIGWPDPRTEDGELLWPNRFPEAAVSELERDLGPYAAAGQLQQRPVPRSGAIFRSEWLRPFPPGFDSIDKTTGKTPREALAIVQFWDTAWSEATTADHTVGCTVGVDRKGDLYVLHIFRDRIGERHLAKVMVEVALEMKAQKVGVELAAYKEPAVQDLLRQMDVLLRRRRGGALAIEGVRVTKDKVFRAQLPASRSQMGKVYVDRHAAWYPAFEQELLRFPRSGEDDQVDAFSGAVQLAIEKVRLDPEATRPYGYDGRPPATTSFDPFGDVEPTVIRRDWTGKEIRQ